MIENGLQVKHINLGGIHFRDDRVEILPYIYLSENEIAILKSIMENGISIECQDLPNATSYDLKKLLEKRK